MAEEFNLKELSNIFRFEDERIKTFSSWKVDFPVDAARLAKAGFYYTGIEDEVVCFSCKGLVNNWNYGEVVQKKHSTMFPNCDFVNNRSNNVPSKRSNNNNNCKNGIKLGSETFSRLNKFEKMKSVQERIVSFKPGWPLQDINIENMAKAGFFYLGYEDKVQCPFCKGIISNWEVVDDPVEEHAKHFPHCNYICDILSDLSLKSQNQKDLCSNNSKHLDSSIKSKLLDKNQEHVNLKKLGVHLHSDPANPQQASFNSRLRSFLSWPTTTPVSIEDLAKAGFFYIGIKDHTKCFHCNGGLCNWEVGDDPWVEHAKWFRNCSFLHLNKGLTFIEECIGKSCNKPQIKSTFQNPNLWLELPTKVDEAMRSAMVKKVLEANMFPSYLIRAAILRQVKSTGISFSTVDDLCVAISSIKEEMAKETLPMNSYKTSDLETHDIDLRKCIIDPCIESNDVKSENILELSVGNSKQDNKAYDEKTKNSKEEYLCIICMEQKVGVVFLPCGHLLACTECASALKICAMCRKTIEATVRAYLP